MAVADNPTTWFEDMVEMAGSFHPVLLECVRAELEKIAAGQGRRSKSARVAIALCKGFQAAPCGEALVDDEIASAAARGGAIVATTDASLALTLGAMKIRVISLSRGRVALR